MKIHTKDQWIFLHQLRLKLQEYRYRLGHHSPLLLAKLKQTRRVLLWTLPVDIPVAVLPRIVEIFIPVANGVAEAKEIEADMVEGEAMQRFIKDRTEIVAPP